MRREEYRDRLTAIKKEMGEAPEKFSLYGCDYFMEFLPVIEDWLEWRRDQAIASAVREAKKEEPKPVKVEAKPEPKKEVKKKVVKAKLRGVKWRSR